MTREEARKTVPFDRRLSHLAVRVWAVLDALAGERGYISTSSQTSITGMVDISSRGLRRCLKELCATRALIAVRRYHSCDYVMSWGVENYEENKSQRPYLATENETQRHQLATENESQRPYLATEATSISITDFDSDFKESVIQTIESQTGERPTDSLINPILQATRQHDLPDHVLLRWLTEKCKHLRSRYPDRDCAGILKKSVSEDLPGWVRKNAAWVEGERRRLRASQVAPNHVSNLALEDLRAEQERDAEKHGLVWVGDCLRERRSA